VLREGFDDGVVVAASLGVTVNLEQAMHFEMIHRWSSSV
jgi:hypothetical protein